jgi:hypothetical protein
VRELGWIAVVFCAVSSVLYASEEQALPTWGGNERADLEAKGWRLGALLLADDAASEESAKALATLREAERAKSEELIEDQKPSPEIAENFLPAYFAERPKSFLVDPQGLLSPSEYRDRLKFLEDHGKDSSIDLFVYLIGGEQEIPGAVREEEVIERFFTSGRPATVIFYYLGAPQRSALYLSPSMTDLVTAAQQRRALESSVKHAFESTEPVEQFEKFLVQMSIRVYWMEPKFPVLPAAPEPTQAVGAEKKITGKSLILLGATEWVKRYKIPICGVVVIFLSGFGLLRWWTGRVRYEFPVFEVEPRLGGAHAAGVGAVISFASAGLPPALQRDQVPDYLRRA